MLDKDVQKHLGKQLRAMYDDVRAGRPRELIKTSPANAMRPKSESARQG